MIDRWRPAAMVLCAALLVAGCSRQESAFRDARQTDSAEGYRAYLRDFPAGTHAAEARARLRWWIDEDDWNRASRLATPEAYQRYLGAHPEGRHATAARERLAALVASGQAPPVPPAPSAPESWIQLGAFGGEPAARQAWSAMQADHPDEVGDLQPRVEPAGEQAPGVWRLLAGPLTAEQAQRRCTLLEARGGTCFVTTR